MMKIRVLILLGVMLSAAMLFFANPARAETTVCGYLDTHPTATGVEDLIGIAVVADQMTPEQAGHFIANEVINWCPRHLLTLQAFLIKWQSKTVYN